jgi:hypothetical protein
MGSYVQKLSLSLAVVLCILVQPTPAPVPRCSPYIIINKIVESNNAFSDSNPYFPVPPCEYGSPQAAIDAGDYKAVFVIAEPEKIPRHNFYESVWLMKTGLPRIMRMFAGGEPYIFNRGILNEGYRHSTKDVRNHQLGRPTIRNPEIMDDKFLYDRIVKGQVADLLVNGPDIKTQNHYTYQGNLFPKTHTSYYGGQNHRTAYQGDQHDKAAYGTDFEPSEAAPERVLL